MVLDFDKEVLEKNKSDNKNYNENELIDTIIELIDKGEKEKNFITKIVLDNFILIITKLCEINQEINQSFITLIIKLIKGQ